FQMEEDFPKNISETSQSNKTSGKQNDRDVIKLAILSLLNNDDDTFYANCRRIASIIKPIKEAIHNLESRTANLADCFISIVKLAAAINRIPSNNAFRESAINVFNKRYTEYDIEPYLLAYLLHPGYRDKLV
ncbi:918_t:CDS:2, partial [Dentiscutata erythropus]